MKIYLDGNLVEKDDAKVSVFDHGLLYGDGVFEGIRAYNGRVFRLSEHLNRLYASANAIMLEIPLSKKDIEAAVIETLRANKLKDAYIRLVVTRGCGDLGLDPKRCHGKPTIFIITDEIKLYPEEFYTNGLSLITASTKRSIPESLNPCIKSLNYLNNIIAKMEATRAGVPEAIMLNAQGYVAECTGDNIFIIKDKVLITPPTWAGALEGITSKAVMELAREKARLEVREDLFTLYHVYSADECFLTGTAAEIIPVVKTDGRTIGDGKPGKMTLRLIEEFRELARLTGVPIYEK
ncbi:MAG: branched-chain-amino-acid transaminase [Elusimicrobia bacterium RIFOXYB2_FULL_50_12]|nr:MAG: branched-chain-amino-acid transaminase [Elusimicrobia bacterium RIFOXYB2_FULL_50_12]